MDNEAGTPPSDDKPRDRAENLPHAPAPWQRTPQESYTPDPAAEGQASHLADDKMSLDSKLHGGGQDLAEEGSREEMRLCPACKGVHTFINGICSSCQHKLGSGGVEAVEEIGFAPTGAEIPWMKVLLVILGIAVIILIAVFVVPPLVKSLSSSGDQGELSSAAPGDTPKTYAGGLQQVTIDEAFHEDLADSLITGNAGWEAEGVDCYVYRYSLGGKVEPATSQSIWITAFVGGEDAHKSIEAPYDIPFRLGTADFLDRINGNAGVSSSISLEYTGGEEAPAQGSVYIRYGYYYGMEHMGELQPIIEALEAERRLNGEYPLKLSGNIVRPAFSTMGGFSFIANGFGYIPIFKTDSAGNIIMGSGSGRASFEPEECKEYYLLMYLNRKSIGLDFHSKSDELYYYDNISPFPYAPKKALRNTPLNPDGEPDGIACVVKNGALLKN